MSHLKYTQRHNYRRPTPFISRGLHVSFSGRPTPIQLPMLENVQLSQGSQPSEVEAQLAVRQ
mgnify:CR=1